MPQPVKNTERNFNGLTDSLDIGRNNRYNGISEIVCRADLLIQHTADLFPFDTSILFAVSLCLTVFMVCVRQGRKRQVYSVFFRVVCSCI
jgi:hypothetical protein